MRVRMIFLVVAILLVAGFVALNWAEFMQPQPLSLGFTVVNSSIGMIMLGLLLLSLIAFIAMAAWIQTQNLIETRHYARELTVQRDLADKAEASRFTELRQYMERQHQETENRRIAAEAALAARITQLQQELQTRIDQSGNSVSAYIGEFEDRLERRSLPGASTA